MIEMGEPPHFNEGSIRYVPVPESINEEADRIINGQRREDYGSADESFKRIATGWSVILGVEVTAMQVVQAMVWLKVCRAINKFDRDSYVDICGYAGLAEVLHNAAMQNDAAPPAGDTPDRSQ